MQLISDGGAVPTARDLGLSASNERPVLDAACTPEPVPIPVLYEDEVLLVVNKPGGLTTMPRGKFVARSVIAQLRWARRDPQIVAAHRLDRLTSGVLVLVKQPEWRGVVQSAFENRTPGLQKHYLARTADSFTASPFTEAAAAHMRWMRLPQHAGEANPQHLKQLNPRQTGNQTSWQLEQQKAQQTQHQHAQPNEMRCGRISGEPHTGETYSVELPLQKERGIWQVQITPSGKPARTELRPLSGGDSFIDWMLTPQSGYTHQLRVTLAALGYPILGDPLYPHVTAAFQGDAAEERLHLHAAQLQLPTGLGGKAWPRFIAPRPW